MSISAKSTDQFAPAREDLYEVRSQADGPSGFLPLTDELLRHAPAGRLRTGDLVRIEIDTVNLTGALDFVGRPGAELTSEQGAAELAGRTSIEGLAPHPDLPADTRLWAALQQVSGGSWGGCGYDVDAIVGRLG